jgi:hypothetical protein
MPGASVVAAFASCFVFCCIANSSMLVARRIPSDWFLAYYIGRFFNLGFFRHEIRGKSRKNGKKSKIRLKIFLTFFRDIAGMRDIPGFGPWHGPKPGGLVTGSNQNTNPISLVRFAFGASVVPVDDGRGQDIVDGAPLSAKRRISSSSNRTFREEKPIWLMNPCFT